MKKTGCTASILKLIGSKRGLRF